ncbi:hypothetical protein L5D93_12585 [Paenibacillus thiaminolyticus]|nr:hypothetical protein [Paenibacillus thiaminolyticus]
MSWQDWLCPGNWLTGADRRGLQSERVMAENVDVQASQYDRHASEAIYRGKETRVPLRVSLSVRLHSG